MEAGGGAVRLASRALAIDVCCPVASKDLARGGLIIVVVVAVLARIGVSDDAWWQGSVLIPSFVAFGDWIQMTGWDSASKVIEQVQST